MNKIAGLISLLTLTVTGEVRGCCESFRLESGGMGEFYQVRYNWIFGLNWVFKGLSGSKSPKTAKRGPKKVTNGVSSLDLADPPPSMNQFTPFRRWIKWTLPLVRRSDWDDYKNTEKTSSPSSLGRLEKYPPSNKWCWTFYIFNCDCLKYISAPPGLQTGEICVGRDLQLW